MNYDDFKNGDEVIYSHIIYKREDPNPENDWLREAKKGKGKFDKWIDAVLTHTAEEKPPHDIYAFVIVGNGASIRVLLQDLYKP